MQKLSKLSKIFLYLTVIFFIVWLGSYIARQLGIYQLFTPENLELKNNFTTEGLQQVFPIIGSVIILNLITFPGFIFFFILFLISSKLSLKKEGWLLITTLIILITAPFEIYLLTYDLEIAQLIFSGSFDPIHVFNLIKERMIRLSSFSLIEIFSYIGIIFLVLFKPLRMK